jgi:type I restriction enzyme S subunit
MEVKPGYKQTEVGVIPVEWDVFQLSEHFRIYAGGDVPKYSVSNFRSETHPYPIFANSLQDGGLYGFTNERRAKADSVTVTARGYLGHAEYRNEPFFPIVRLLVLEPSGALDAQFTTFAINERVKFAFESTGVPQLTAPQIGKYSVAAPPPPEQRAIAEALSDVDRLLGGLNRLIAKKRDLKQAAMQQLLTGQTRLPGFHGEWDYVELKSLYAKVFKKSPLSSADGRTLGAYPLFVSGGEAKRTDLATFQNTEALIISDGGVFDVKFFSGEFSVTDHCFVITLKGDMRFYFQWMSLRKAELDLMTFKGSGLRNLDKPTLGKVAAPLPPPSEQIAIAEVLSEMDAELESLQSRRDKTARLKQAMMQELLSGRIRLAPLEV